MTYKRKTDRPAKPFSNPEKLISLWRWMEAYFKEHQRHASNRELVDAGFASSTSVIRFYFDHMALFGMLERDPGIARGLRLNKPAKFHPIIKSLLEQEKQTDVHSN